MKLLSMSGFVPEQICDVVRFNGYSGERNISHYCGYANDYISQVLHDSSIDGAVFPKSCDSSRIIMSYLSESDKFTYQINVPARNDHIAARYLAQELESYKSAVEQYFNIEIADITERIDYVNKRNTVIGMQYASLENSSYCDYLTSIHRILSQPLLNRDFEFQCREKKDTEKRVYLVGSYLANENIAEIIESSGLGIVGDNLPESGRLANSVINNSSGNLYEAIAVNLLERRLSPTQNNFKQILNYDLAEIKENNVDAVIYITQKYCEPYDYLYSVYRKHLDELQIPVLKLSMTDSEDNRKTALAVEAFSESI